MQVTDYTALLAYLETESTRWNAIADLGTQTVVTYSFYESDNLPEVTGSGVGQTTYWSYSAAQRDSFRDALDVFEQAAGLRFVEVEGEAMINAFGYDIFSSTVGWAYYPGAWSSSTYSADLAIGNGDFSVGGSRFDTILHEIGHSLGLEHPHEGTYTLAPSVDTRANTVMTYSPGRGDYLGPFDIEALQHIYGADDSFDGWRITGGGSDPVKIRATGGADTILAVDVDTKVVARGGADFVRGREGDDTLKGGSGSDELIGAFGNDTIWGGRGNDVLRGNLDDLDYSGDSNEADVLKGQKGNDTLYGNNGDDNLNGGAGRDLLIGGYGDDVLIGGGGKDTLVGGNGDDTMTGGAGADVFVFSDDDIYETHVITDYQAGIDMIDLSAMNPSNIGPLTVTQTASGTTLTYYSWFEIELTGFSGTLTDSDFLFA